MRYWLVMPAAGASRRFSGSHPKQYAELAGRTVLEWALAPFRSDRRCAGILVALASDDARWPAVAARLDAVTAVTGGAERSQSVRNALAALAGQAATDDWVLVHDAARPCLRVQDRDRLLEELAGHAVGGLLAAPVADTVKRVDPARSVAETVDRGGLWRAQTPQMFRYGRLCLALDRALAAGRFPTDEAQALEWLGDRPRVVEGSPHNIKVTTAEDLRLAAALLAAEGARA